jgi:hypothetical protein
MKASKKKRMATSRYGPKARDSRIVVFSAAKGAASILDLGAIRMRRVYRANLSGRSVHAGLAKSWQVVGARMDKSIRQVHVADFGHSHEASIGHTTRRVAEDSCEDGAAGCRTK